MGVLTEMARVMTKIAQTASEITNPRTTVVVFQEELPNKFATNGMLLGTKIVAAVPVQGAAPVVAFPRSRVFAEAEALNAAGRQDEALSVLADTRFMHTKGFQQLTRIAAGPQGEPRILIRGLSADFTRVIRNESHDEFLARVVAAAPTAITDVVVNGPAALDRTPYSLAERLRDVTGNDQLSVIGTLPGAQAAAVDRYVVKTDVGEQFTNGLQLGMSRLNDASYSSVMLPTDKLAKEAKTASNIPVFTVQVPPASTFNGAQSLEDQYRMSGQVFRALSTEEVDVASVEAALAIEAQTMGQEVSGPSFTQGDFGLGA